jgi:hypothetical protein
MSKEKLNPTPVRPAQLKEDTNKSLQPPQFKLDASAVQRKMGEAQATASAGSATTLSDGVRSKMEKGIGTDLSGVKIYPDSEKAVTAGALAYTQGSEVHFAPGQYQPGTQSGQELIGHELAHVKQQKEGTVNATGAVGGMPLNDDKHLEAQADSVGKAAAEGKSAAAPLQAKEASSNGQGPVQRFKMAPEDMAKYPKFAQFLMSDIPTCINDARLVKYLNQNGTNQGSTSRDVRKDLQFGEGPLVKPWSLPANKVSFQSNKGSEVIRLSRGDISNYEKNNDFNSKFHQLVLESNIMNGYTQFLDDQDGKDLWGKEGVMTEKAAFGRNIESVYDAKKSTYATFGQGNWEISVESASSDKAHRLKVWNSDGKDGNYDIQAGTTMKMGARKNVNLNFVVESNTGDVKDKKAWYRADMIKAADGKDNFVVRAESGSDRGRDEVVVRVRKTS